MNLRFENIYDAQHNKYEEKKVNTICFRNFTIE